MGELKKNIDIAVEYIRSKTNIVPEVGIICGTGMGELAGKVKKAVRVPYEDIPPHKIVSTVESHAGNFIIGELAKRKVIVMQGRFHRYEGYSLQEVTFPVRVMRALGAKFLFVMNATGSVNPLIPAGSLVVLTDHVNLMGDNPLIGPNEDELGPRFPDMSEPYDKKLIALAEDVARESKISVKKGTFVAVTGPNLETAAEYRFFQRIGVDLVSMSTVPEVIVAVHGGMRVFGFSTVTDNCLPDSLKPANIKEIIDTANSKETERQKIIIGLLERLDEIK